MHDYIVETAGANPHDAQPWKSLATKLSNGKIRMPSRSTRRCWRPFRTLPERCREGSRIVA